jgi:hypothetical protein
MHEAKILSPFDEKIAQRHVNLPRVPLFSKELKHYFFLKKLVVRTVKC